MQKQKDMHPEDIKCAIRKRGITLTRLSIEAGLSESAVRMSIIFNCVPAADQIVSKFLNIPLHKIWPSRYDKSDTRIVTRSSRSKNITKKISVRHCQKGEAA